MASKTPLRAIGDGETPESKKPPMTLMQAVEAGDYLEILRAQRRDIATCLPDEKGPAKAAMHRQLSIIAKEIELLEAREAQEEQQRGTVSDGAFDAAAI